MPEESRPTTRRQPILAQLRPAFLMIGLVTAVSAVLIGMALLIHFRMGVPFGDLTRDPVSIGELPVYAGFLSQAGIFFWAAAATVCFFAFRVLVQRRDRHPFTWFLFFAGALSLLLGLDDAFLLHERVFPRLGVPQKFVHAGYASCVLLYLLAFRRVILDTEYVLLALALVGFAVSLSLDFASVGGVTPFLIEDGAKLIGIVSWQVYFFHVAAAAVTFNTAD